MARELDYEWRLRLRMAERGMFTSKPLVRLLAEHGIALSESQVWRLVTGKPERLNLHVLVVLCKILDCTPNDLIQPVEATGSARLERRSAAQAGASEIVPKRARIRRPPKRRDA
jgi:DNA-binding Xre family transcriptional regulator